MDKKKTSIQVLERAGRLLDSIAGQPQPVSLKYLSAETGLHPSTSFRILSTLLDMGFVQRDEEGGYTLGIRLQQLGSRVSAHVDIRSEARAVMEWLRDRVGETVNLTVREGDEVVYLERAGTNRMMRVEQVIGSRAPLHVTAVGKLMLGESGDEELGAYVRRTGLPRYTKNTITDMELLKRDIRNAKKRGYALDNEEAEIGVGCIGVLVKDWTGKAVAGLSISSPIDRRRKEWIGLIQEAGQRLSMGLGYRDSAS